MDAEIEWILAPLFRQMSGNNYVSVYPLLIIDGKATRYRKGSLNMSKSGGVVDISFECNGSPHDYQVPSKQVSSVLYRRSGRPLYCVRLDA